MLLSQHFALVIPGIFRVYRSQSDTLMPKIGKGLPSTGQYKMFLTPFPGLISNTTKFSFIDVFFSFQNQLVIAMSQLKLTKAAPEWSGTAVVNGEFKDIKLSDYKVTLSLAAVLICMGYSGVKMVWGENAHLLLPKGTSYDKRALAV